MTTPADSPRRPRNRRGHGDRLRADIVEAAVRLIEEGDGTGSMSLRAVARAVGVAATSIYLHFDTIEELAEAARQRLFDDFAAALEASVSGRDVTPRERIDRFGQAYADFATSRPAAYEALFGPSPALPRLVRNQPSGVPGSGDVPGPGDGVGPGSVGPGDVPGGVGPGDVPGGVGPGGVVPGAVGPGGVVGLAAFRLFADAVAEVVGAEAAPIVAVQIWCATHGAVTLRQSMTNFGWPPLPVQLTDLADRLLR